MKKQWLFMGMILLLLMIAVACAPQKIPIKKDSAGRPVGDPMGRVINTKLSCEGHCSGYAASGDEWCFCDIPCSKNKNCCSDFASVCPELVH